MHTDPKKAALVGAVMLGGVHTLWSLLVLLNWAQPLVNFSMWAHMVHKDGVVVGPFDAVAAATVIVIAACIGYCVGYTLATVWNKVHRA